MIFFKNISISYWFVFIFLFISSAFKPIGSFIEGLEPRIFSRIPTMLGAFDKYFLLIFLCLSLIVILKIMSPYKIYFMPKLTTPEVLFLSLKIYLIFVSIYNSNEFSWLVEDLIVLLVLFIIVILIRSIFISKELVVNLLDTLFYFSLIFASLTLFELIINPTAVSFSGRFFGLTIQPNTVGAYSALLSIICLWKYSTSKIYIIKYVAGASFLVLFFFVLASASRASNAIFFIGLFVYLLPSFTITNFVKMLIVVTILFILITTIYYEQITEYFNLERIFDDTDTRVLTKEIFRETFLSSPIFGVGVFTQSTANSYYVILVRGGVIGLMLLLSSILCVVAYNIKNINVFFRSNEFRCLITLMLMLLSGGMYEGYLIDNFSLTSMVFLILISVLSNKRGYWN